MLGNDLGGIPAALVVGVFLADDALAGNPFFDHVRTVADIGFGFCCPCVAVFLNSSLLNGAESCESNELVKVRAGISKLDGKGLAVLACLNIELVKVGSRGGLAFFIGVADSIVVAFDHAANGFGIGSCEFYIADTLKGILEVLSVEVGAVGPFKTVTHFEGPSESVGAYFP